MANKLQVNPHAHVGVMWLHGLIGMGEYLGTKVLKTYFPSIQPYQDPLLSQTYTWIKPTYPRFSKSFKHGISKGFPNLRFSLR
jgi:hypothetical protein